MKDLRLAALRRFAAAISVLTLLGHLILGFEQSYAHVVVALITAYGVELALEQIDALANGTRPAFRRGWIPLVDFLLPAHITGLACAMLLYPNDRLGPIAFAAAFGVCSKTLLRATVGKGKRHFMNPSNAGIVATLLVFPWVGVAMPYQFTENLTGAADWVLPGVFICVGTFLNYRFTGRMPLIIAWLGGFALQAVIRGIFFDVRLGPALAPMTGVAFILFTFYMVSDPGTTPTGRREQVWFGASVAAAYGVLQVFHIVYGLFFALAIVCAARGCSLWIREAIVAARRTLARVDSPMPIVRNSIEGGA
jgi:enediyne biosynthesis protein E5